MPIDDILNMIFYLVGGLGIFLMGMRNLSDGMQVIAGERLRRIIGSVTDHRVLAVGAGALTTVIIQSSSITTSLLVPRAGAGILKLRQAFPITLGANIGTTVTALLAALAATDENAAAGLTIAWVHLLFNLSGTVLIYPIKQIRNIPLAAARKMADIAVESRKWALVYILLMFYALPALFAIANRLLG